MNTIQGKIIFTVLMAVLFGALLGPEGAIGSLMGSILFFMLKRD